MSQSERLRPVCKALGLSHYRVEGWVARNAIQMSQSVVAGQARLLTKRDGLTIALAAALTDLGMEVAKLPFLNLDLGIEPLAVGRSFLVVYPSDPYLLAPAKRGEKSTAHPTKGQAKLHRQILAERDLAEFLDGRIATIIDLNMILDKVNRAFNEISEARK